MQLIYFTGVSLYSTQFPSTLIRPFHLGTTLNFRHGTNRAFVLSAIVDLLFPLSHHREVGNFSGSN